jgi:photoactive yellow protein
MSTPLRDDLSALTAAEIDSLPFGYIALAPDGTIRKYNRYEADLARKDPQEVLGRNFFHEVAPCTQVREFEGRFREFVDSATPEPVLAFEFEFGFRHGTQAVRIGLVRSPLAQEVIVTVNRLRRLALPVEPGVRSDTAAGRLEDAAGQRVALANEDFWRALDSLWRHAPEGQRREALLRVGRDWGLRHAQRVERVVQRTHGLTLREAELQLALECLSGSLGLLGLGRFDVLFEHRQRGLLVIDHYGSPFAELLGDREGGCCDVLAGLHSGFLTHLSGRLLSGLELRCGHSAGEPCRFAVGTETRLGRLTRPAAASSDAALLASLGGRAASVETHAEVPA